MCIMCYHSRKSHVFGGRNGQFADVHIRCDFASTVRVAHGGCEQSTNDRSDPRNFKNHSTIQIGCH